jgi:hypothetical protein
MPEIRESQKPQKMLRERVVLNGDVVKLASALATAKSPQLAVWSDKATGYFMIRQRGGAAKWAVKAFNTTRIIGDVRERHAGYLSPRAARERAAEVYAELKSGPPPEAPAAEVTAAEKPPGWTWRDLDREYQEMMSRPRWVNRREKPPSQGTSDDIRLAFARPSFQAMHGTLLTGIDRLAVNEARDAIESHRQKEKNIAYFRAAMNWAAEDEQIDRSGLDPKAERWWNDLKAGKPTPEQMATITGRRALHLEHKAALDVEAIGELLVRHERYCAGKSANEKISPGIRFGLWWVCFTANRRLSTVKLLRDDFMEQDPQDPTMGRAMWPADTMKAKQPFWLPLPPAVRDVAAGSITDWTQLVRNQHNIRTKPTLTRWVFASNERVVLEEETKDVLEVKDISVYPNSLNRHLARMRERGHLDGLPYFSLHLARTVMANFLDKNVSPVASSLVLAHSLPNTAEESSPTTRDHYLTSQRMDVKSEAMTAWTEALTASVKKAKGALPAPREKPRAGKAKQGSA